MMTLAGDASYDVRVWAIRVYKGKRGTTYIVTWLVAGARHQQTFATRKLAESFRAGLITAARGGAQFFASDGLPGSLRTDLMERLMKGAQAAPGKTKELQESFAEHAKTFEKDMAELENMHLGTAVSFDFCVMKIEI